MITLDKEQRKKLRNKENQLLANLYHNIDTLSKKRSSGIYYITKDEPRTFYLQFLTDLINDDLEDLLEEAKKIK